MNQIPVQNTHGPHPPVISQQMLAGFMGTVGTTYRYRYLKRSKNFSVFD